MKRVQFLAVGGALLSSLFAPCLWAAEDDAEFEKFFDKPSFAYIPSGFDDNDITEIVIDGLFPNTCYQVGATDVFVDHDQRLITIGNEAVEAKNQICLMWLVHYQKTIPLGRLNVGQYEVRFKSGDKTESYGRVNVAKAKKISADDFLYAPVSDAYFVRGKKQAESEPLTHSMVLVGRRTSTCMRLKEPRIVTEASPRVIEILPLAEMIAERECKEINEPFEMRVELKDLRPNEKYLIHIRSLNGQSVNRLVETYE
jgi:hypothetical protein